jgi:hypothetical protein
LKKNTITVKESIYGNIRIYNWKDCLQFTKAKKR